MQISTRMASPEGMLKVSVVNSATPSVAVRPGSMPTTMPSSVAQAMWKSEPKVRKPRIAWKK